MDKTQAQSLVLAFKELFKKADIKLADAPPAGDAPAEATPKTLKDGTKINVYGDLAQGTKVMIVQEDGSEMPAPDGEHILEDGSTITIADGTIAAIVAAEPEGDMSAEYEKLAAEHEDLKKKYSDLEAQIKGSIEEQGKFAAKLARIEEMNAKSLEIFEALAGIPAKEPEQKENKFGKVGRADKVLALAENLKSIHNPKK